MKRAFVLALGAIAACRAGATVEHASPSPVASATPAIAPLPEADSGVYRAPDSAPDAGPPALAGEAFQTWHIGELDVAAVLPVGARDKRPVVVGIHGSRDRPEAACARWRRAFGGYPFIVCPKGVPWRGGLAWGSPLVVAERIDGALAALRERHGAFVADGPVVYAGWSLGATRGPKVVAARPSVFDLVVLAELGHTRIDAKTSAAELAKGRTTKAVIACATKKCALFSQRLERASGGRPPVVFADAGIGRGHLFDDRTAGAIGAAIATAVAADPRWSGLSAALAASADAGAPEPLPTEEDEDPEH